MFVGAKNWVGSTSQNREENQEGKPKILKASKKRKVAKWLSEFPLQTQHLSPIKSGNPFLQYFPSPSVYVGLQSWWPKTFPSVSHPLSSTAKKQEKTEKNSFQRDLFFSFPPLQHQNHLDIGLRIRFLLLLCYCDSSRGLSEKSLFLRPPPRILNPLSFLLSLWCEEAAFQVV